MMHVKVSTQMADLTEDLKRGTALMLAPKEKKLFFFSANAHLHATYLTFGRVQVDNIALFLPTMLNV